MSDSNVKRLVDKLSRMRGAALKLGQFLSIQGASILRSSRTQLIVPRVQMQSSYLLRLRRL